MPNEQSHCGSYSIVERTYHMTELVDATARTAGDDALDLIFREARTHTSWTDKEIPDGLFEQIYDLAKMGPTSANLGPGRFLILKSKEAKERLLPALAPMNVEKSRTASAVVIVAYDSEFYEHAPRLWPHGDARSWFVGNDLLIAETALRNSSLQGAYFMLAARALGLDCGPMSGFDAGKVNAEFFPDGKWKANFVINLGYGDKSKLHPRLARLDFDEACKVL